MGSAATEEASVDQVYRLLVEVKYYLSAMGTESGARLARKVEFVLDNWNDGNELDRARDLAQAPGYDPDDVKPFEDSDEN